MLKENRIVLVENTPGRTARLVSRVASIPLSPWRKKGGWVGFFAPRRAVPAACGGARHTPRVPWRAWRVSVCHARARVWCL